MFSLLDLFSSRTKGSLSFVPRTLSETIDTSAARALQRALELTLGTVDLVVTDNRRRMVTAKKNRNRHQIRIHHMFVGCEDDVFESLVGFVNDDPDGRKGINKFIADNNDVIRHQPHNMQLNAEGEVYDLELFRTNMLGFLGEGHGLDDVKITWGRYGTGTRSIRFGSYDFSQRLIRIHPALDAEWVPDFFVEYVVYHELLHGLFPPDESQERRSLHPPEFRAKEKEYPMYEEAIRWENNNIDRLLKR